MRRQHVQISDFRPDRHLRTMDLDLASPGQHGRTTRSAGLEPSEKHGIAGIRRVNFQMVEHAATRRHAARRNDDGRQSVLIDRLGFLDTARPNGEAAHVAAFRLA